MEIRDFKTIENPNSPMKASFVVHIPEWDFNLAMTYFERNDGSNWFGYPKQEWTNPQGEKKYKWMAFFGDKGKERFEKALKEKVRPLLQKPVPQASNDIEFNNNDLPF